MCLSDCPGICWSCEVQDFGWPVLWSCIVGWHVHQMTLLSFLLMGVFSDRCYMWPSKSSLFH